MIYAHDTLPYVHTDLGTLQSYHPFDHRKFPALEREIFKREFKPGRLLDNALIVGKGFEACFAVVTAHAAVSHAAKGKFTIREVHQHIIHRATTKRYLIQHFLT